MPPDGDSVGLARAWLRRARGNLARARQPRPEEGLWEDLCFDAQQGAEKAVKAVLVFRGVDFPRTHQIAELLVLLRAGGHDVPEHLWAARDLSDYAVAPEPMDPHPAVDEDEHRRAVELAEQVVRWAEEIIGGP